MNQPIAIVGASARAAAASALRAGFQPVTADLFADADLRAIATTTRISPYPEGIVDWLRTIEPPAWMYTGALENHPELVDQMAWISPLWGNPGDVLERVRSPRELARTIRDAGLLFPDTRESAAGLPLDGSWLAKTYRGASGSGVRVLGESGRGGEWERVRHVETTVAPEFPPLPLSPSPPLCFQRRIVGTPCSAVFVATSGTAELLGISRQLVGEGWLGAHGFQYAGSIGPLLVSAAAQSTMARIGQVLAEQFELIGIFGVDFILDGDKVWTLEVNPRYTASVEICERATGVSAIKLHACACAGDTDVTALPGMAAAPIGGEDAPARSGAGVHAKAILFAKREVQISESFAHESLGEALITPWPTLADVSPAGTMIEVGRPILTVFAEGATVDDAKQRLRQRVDELEQQIYGSDVPS